MHHTAVPPVPLTETHISESSFRLFKQQSAFEIWEIHNFDMKLQLERSHLLLFTYRTNQ